MFVRTAPLPVRFGFVGATSAAALGAIVGLVIGLHVNAPTAPFAAVEVGFPAAIAGALVGLIAGAATVLVRRAAAS